MSNIVEVKVTFQTSAEKKEEAVFKLLKIFVSPGQKVAENDPLAEIDTEKGVQDLESPVSGTVKCIFIEAGADTEYSYGAVLCAIEAS